MKKWSTFILVFLVVIVAYSVSATKAEVVIVDDVGSFSGAVLRVVSPITGDVGEKIYPSAYLVHTGVIKFDIETSLKKINLKVLISKDGFIVDAIEDGPFAINGSRILFDRRDGVNRSFADKTSVVEKIDDFNISQSLIKNDSDNYKAADNSSNVEKIDSVVVKDASRGGMFETKVTSVFLTGKSVFIKEDGTLRVGSSLSGILFILMLVIFVFIGHSRIRQKKKVENILSDDDKELDYMEKKIRDTENRISKIKSTKERRAKVDLIKNKLTKEEKELQKLERDEREESEKVEDI